MQNLIITAYRGEMRNLMRELKKHGEFKITTFRDVITGSVNDIDEFVQKMCDEPPLSMARITPIDEIIEFVTPEELISKLEERVKKIKINADETFRVTVERRGHKGELNSSEWEKKLGSLIEGKVKLKDPDKEVLIEVMENWAGFSIIKKETKEKYYLIKTN